MSNFSSQFNPNTTPPLLSGLDESLDALREVGRMFYARGWSLGTSSNYSVVLGREPLELLITASGKDKGRLTRADFVRVGPNGQALPGQPKSSAETLLHVVAAERDDVGAVLHTHSVWSTLLSDYYFPQGGLSLEGYEMLKGFEGIRTHEATVWVPVFDNTQDIPVLAEQVRQQFAVAERSLVYGYLIRRHGLYTWGRDLDEARRHVEIFEFLLECHGRHMMLTGQVPFSLAQH